MAGFDNEIVFANGMRLEPSSAQDIALMQATATDVSRINGTGSPEGVVSANPSSLYHDHTVGGIWKKATGTGNTGWVEISGGGADLHTAKFIVGDTTDGANYDYADLQQAIDDASATNSTVFLQDGDYPLDLVLQPSTNLASFSSLQASTTNAGGARVVGKITASYTGSATISNINLISDGDYAVSVTGASTTLILQNCPFRSDNAGMVEVTNGSLQIYGGRYSKTGSGLEFTVSGGTVKMYSLIGNTDNRGTGASTVSAGSFEARGCVFTRPITTSGTAALDLRYSQVFPSGNTTALTCGGSGLHTIAFCDFSSGSASSIVVSNTTTITNTKINSSNSDAVANTGTIKWAGIVFTDGFNVSGNEPTVLEFIPSGGGISSLKNTPEFFDDFIWGSGTSSDVGELGWTFTQNGGTFFQTDALDHPGIAQIQTTGSASGRGAILSRNQINLRVASGELTYECVMKMDQLSNGTDTFVQNFGLGESVTTALQGNGIYFTYTDSINSGNWTLRTSSASSPTAVDSGVAATTNWTNLKIVVNAAATSVEYFIDGVLVGTITTTIPTGPLGFMFGIFRSAGTVNIQTNIDAFYAKYALTTPRFL